MNKQEKEQYLREYSILKSQGKPFFPYAVAKDALMACVVMAVIILMSLILGAELGPKADPTTTTYTPRPEWYFFFLFELLRVIKPAALVPLATIGIPTICMILLFLLPFYDRNAAAAPRAPSGRHDGRHPDDRARWRSSPTRAPMPARRRRSTCRRRWPSSNRARRRSRSSTPAARSRPSRAAWPATRSATTATTAPGRP